jgi:uncharacterized protein involved in propanediol utilization
MKASLQLAALASLLVIGTFTIPFSAAQEEEETPLAKEMNDLNSALKKFKKAATTDEKVALAHEAQASIIKSLDYLPMMFADIQDAKEKAKAGADYKRMIGLSYVKLCELETAVLEENAEKIETISGELKELKSEGHKKYTEE